MSKSYIEESRLGWFREGLPTNDDLKLGCLQRIASATELACKDREKLERDYAYMRRSRDEAKECSARLARSNAALRGVIKRMKRQAAKP
jgi:hypothetical protein